MTKVDQAFLREVQARGWQIEAVMEDGCVGRCPASGCAMRARLKLGASIPTRVAGPESDLVEVRSFEDARIFLRSRRERLRLTIAEVEDVAGLTADHLAKAEKDNPTRNVNLDTLVEWAQALGYQVVLKPIGFNLRMLRVLAETRGQEAARGRRFDASRDGRLPRP